MDVTWVGSISVESTSRNTMFRPRQSIRENA